MSTIPDQEDLGEAYERLHQHAIYSEYECEMCGCALEEPVRFCSDECISNYRHQNRTCEDCGGEFWDGGTTCICEPEN